MPRNSPDPKALSENKLGSSSRYWIAWATVWSLPIRTRGFWFSTRPLRGSWATGKVTPHAQDWSRHYEIFVPERTVPYPADDLPLVRAIRGESVDHAELYIAYPSRDDGTWILVTGRPLRDEHGAAHRAAWSSFTISPVARKQSEDSRPNMKRPAFWPRRTRPPNPSRRSSRRFASVSTGTLGAFWRVDSLGQRLRCGAAWRRLGGLFCS